MLMNPSEEQEVAPIDADPLNNARVNLRRSTKRQRNLTKKTITIEGFSGIHKTIGGTYKAIDQINLGLHFTVRPENKKPADAGFKNEIATAIYA